jgi:hypothetical protein
MSGIITLSFFSAEIEVQKDFDFFRSRLHFVRCCGHTARGSSDPLVSDLQLRLGPTDQGTASSPDTTRRPEVLEPSTRVAMRRLFESARGLPDIHFLVEPGGQQPEALLG